MSEKDKKKDKKDKKDKKEKKEKKKKEKVESSESSNSDEEDLDYSAIKQNYYDPKTSDRIICIELENNQHVLISYTEKSTIKDIIVSLLNRHEYQLLNQDRNMILNAPSHLAAFDLNLCFYDDVKPPQDNKVAFDVLLDELHFLGLLKNYRLPFLVLKQNFAPMKYTYSNLIKVKKLFEMNETNYNQYAMYFDFLPRMVKWVPNALLAHPEVEDFISRNKKGYNEFTPYRRNKLTYENDTLDWFIYDKESINFLHEMNNEEFQDFAGLKFFDGKVFFEDKCIFEEDKSNNNSNNNNQSKDQKEQKEKKEKNEKIIANFTLIQSDGGNQFSKKIEIDANSTGLEVIQKMISKLTIMDEKLKFDPKTKILKVRSLNDYVFDLNEPLIKYTYINECLKMNKTPDFLILDNPKLENGHHSSDGGSSSPSTPSDVIINAIAGAFFEKRSLSSVPVEIQSAAGKNDLENIAMYSPTKNTVNNDILKSNKALEKSIFKNQTQGSSLDKLVDLIDTEIKNNLKNDWKNKKVERRGKDNALDEYMLNNDSKQINYKDNLYNTTFLKEKQNMFLRVNGSGSMYFQKKKKYRKFHQLNKKNVFMKNQEIEQKTKNNKSQTPNIKPLINPIWLHVSNVMRPFSILFKCADINSDFPSSEAEPMVLIFKFDLFCSSSQLGTSKQIRYVTKNGVKNPVFNKRIYFDVSYSDLPSVCSILFRVKYIPQNNTKVLNKKEDIFWANYRLFDQNDKLKVGLHKVNLNDEEVTDSIYYFFSDSTKANSNKIYFEIENFVCPIVNKVNYTQVETVKAEEPQLELDNEQLLKILKIDEKSPFDELNHQEKNILWRNRFGIAKMNSLIPKLFLSSDSSNPNTNKEYQKIIQLVTDLTIVQAIELLSGKYVNEIVRSFAVSILRKAPVGDIKIYLLQLVQALKYEKNIDNSLARFLIKHAIEHPITIGHEFFWHLRAEMHNQEVQKKFGLYLEVFVNKITLPLYKIFKDEDLMLKTLVGYAEKVINNPVKEERDKNFKADLASLNDLYKQKKKEVSLPLNFKYRVKGLIVEKCKIMQSKKKPLWLTFENADPYGEPIVCMLKCGDDLRMDMVTLQLFQSMQTLWFENGLKVKMALYKVLCTGNMQGMLEMVRNSDTLANIHVQEGGAIKQLISITAVANWIEKNCKSLPLNEAKENFLISNVAYCLATFVLGIGDRHNDNIMMKRNGELFHIDFGHFLGHFKYKMGIKRERAPFVFTRQFQYVLGGDDSELFKKFKEKLDFGYSILRKNKDVVVTLLRMLLCTGIPELNEKSLKFLETSLALKKNDRDASDFLEKKLYESMDSFSTKFNFAIHIVANK